MEELIYRIKRFTEISVSNFFLNPFHNWIQL